MAIADATTKSNFYPFLEKFIKLIVARCVINFGLFAYADHNSLHRLLSIIVINYDCIVLFSDSETHKQKQNVQLHVHSQTSANVNIRRNNSIDQSFVWKIYN